MLEIVVLGLEVQYARNYWSRIGSMQGIIGLGLKVC